MGQTFEATLRLRPYATSVADSAPALRLHAAWRKDFIGVSALSRLVGMLGMTHKR
jgi:hypothetical protein